MSLRFHEIAEGHHRILNPTTHEKLMLVGELCHLDKGTHVLDLACGKAEMLCQWAKHWDITGTGVDISTVFIDSAKKRALELGVEESITVIEADAANYITGATQFDIVSCIGAAWIGGSMVGTLNMLKTALKPDGLILVGEPFWLSSPPYEIYAAMGVGEDEFTSLVGTLDRIEEAGLELIEMVAADTNSWDRYVTAQWATVDRWLRENPADPEAENIRAWNTKNRRIYLEYQRQYWGWAIFVARVK